MSIAWTMMLHSAVYWPDVADAMIWPITVTHSIFLHNHAPNLVASLCSSDAFSRSRWEQSTYHDLHVWGSPVYVLEKAVADGKKLPHWKPRSLQHEYGTFQETRKHSPLSFESRGRVSLLSITLYLMTGLQRFQRMLTPSQILTQCVGPDCLAIQDINSHLMKATITKQQRKRE
jgi:hypothetical protein